MGGFSIWHWIIVLVIALTGAGVIALVVWAIVKTVNRSAGRPPSPPSD